MVLFRLTTLKLPLKHDSQLIVAQAVTQEANDKQQVSPMVDVIQKQAGQKPEELLADSGYCSEKNLKYLQRKRISAYVATDRQKHGRQKQLANRGRCRRGDQGGQNETKISDQSPAPDLCGEEIDRGTGIRADQACAGLQAISLARN